MARRDLNGPERHLAARVFLYTVPFGRIRVTDRLGLFDRPYTLNHQGFEGEDTNTYSLNVGPDLFKGMEQHYKAFLIHELVHVWQSCHSAWAPSFIFSSIWHQATSKDAYAYSPGEPWDDYNVEQQAHIVQDWFVRGQSDTDSLFPYIRDAIRAAKTMK
jgi:hypothetical protein